MRRTIAVAVAIIGTLVPIGANASVDLSCTASATAAVTGRVQNTLGQALAGMHVELFATNSQRAVGSAITDAGGAYRVCASAQQGVGGHDTYDVHVRDLRSAPEYAAANQPYTTFTNVTGTVDFTPASGLPMQYQLNLTITPAAISTKDSARTATWLVRSKAPSGTTMRLALGHNSTEVSMASAGTEAGGPAAGGWNRWTYSFSFPKNSAETLWWATARGRSSGTVITQTDRRPYVIDNRGPLFGYAGADLCGPGVVANPMSPAAPAGTTNPQPVVFHGVCDHWSSGARSGLDPFSLTGTLCTNSAMTADCRTIDPVLNVHYIVWWPEEPLAVGDYYIRWHIADLAGNVSQNQTPVKLVIADQGGQTPVIGALQPGNLGQGTTFGIVAGSTLTTPISNPYAGFRVTDADGYNDLVPGSLRVRIYYNDERTLVYDYDPTMGPTAYDPLTKRGGATFDMAGGWFNATGYRLQGKAPGRYIATASISDHGGNSAVTTWHWLLVAAA